MGKTIHINGVDFTKFLSPWGYSISYRKVSGGNQTVMRDGSTQYDTIAVKANIRHNCMPLTDEELSVVSSTAYKDFLSVRYYDPRLGGAYRTASFVGSISPAIESGAGPDGVARWTGVSLTLEEI